MPEKHLASWIVWALLSAAFAALTAIFAKVGVENINSDLATFIRTIVILVVLGGILVMRGLFQPLASISSRTYLFLTLSGMATGLHRVRAVCHAIQPQAPMTARGAHLDWRECGAANASGG